MNFIIKQKWFVIFAWILVAAGLFMAAPNMAELVREKGQITVPDEYSSTLAGKIMDDVRKQEGGGDDTQVALVFHSEKKLTPKEIEEAEKAISELEKNSEEIGITDILTHFNEESLKDQLVSDDGKSILTSVTVNWNDREPGEVSKLLYETIEDVKVDHYYTSQWLINEDLMNSSEEGLKKTEGITVVFILVVLLLVFRSVVAPVIPLLTVGMSYLVSQSIVAMLVDRFDFPLSNYTQIFLVAVLFGIGTDYCILLLSRFKEEMAHNESVPAAIVATYKNAGRTVFFSGVAVMIGFAAIGFSQFILYQSAAAVAIGVAMLLLGLFTIVPFFMAVLGHKIFWPSKQSAEHGESKLWGTVGSFSLARPFLSLLIVAAVCVPFLFAYDGELSYNSLDEISGDVNSIKAFNAIADSFGPGESMPTQVILKNDERMDSAEYIELAEKISSELEKVNLVDTVRSVTRPTGEPIEDFFVSKQAETLGSGIGEGKEGLDKISEGLQEAETELSKSAPELEGAADGINQLINGTTEIKSGLGEIQNNLVKIENGIRQGSSGSDQIQAGLAEAKAGAEALLAGYKQLQSKYVEMQTGLAQLEGGYQRIGDGLSGLSAGISQTQQTLFSHIESEYGADDDTYKTLKTNLLGMQNQLAQTSAGLDQLNDGLSQLTGGMAQANEAFAGALAQQANFGPGLQQLIDGIEQQQAGLNQLADGQGQIVANFPKLSDGLTGINAGQQQLLAGFGGLGGQLDQLTDGLGQSTDGLNQVSEGLGSAQEYLAGLAKSDSNSFYLPADVLESEEFTRVFDVYMSNDRKVMTMDVIFEANPYSNEAMAQVAEIEEAVERATKGTKLENADVAIGGITSTNADLDTMSGQDYSRTVILMLLGIGIILVFLFRSIIMPIYIIGSLILTYYTAMAVNEVIYVDILGYSGISWAVPFFAFVILVALGVDYSIFLMDRFNEYKNLSISEAMLLSMKKMGTVIISAAIILGGTFAAMMPSGMMSLLQIASILLVGLFLYAFIMLPLFIPVLVKNFGEANWWPFKRV
ncbi:MMPL family transporter [Mesobacillus selenatarsenatis]|uniref:Putative membrane protein n=1 Tax=Mesobacillus selenatarsenatis (strain DSM 18680 / JCM 14380 / FERM P-15431 / SF-1) TaxID=1321606 RepID=A0A0A8X5I6_MESS1|nr:MMPL family transporter [Mesobacillus selenatarsenatis]GAM14292.1 putative membrane protein [Mesobacillus selenatarsenatis SF-1]